MGRKTAKLVEIDLGFFSKPVDKVKGYSSKMKAVMDFKSRSVRHEMKAVMDFKSRSARHVENKPLKVQQQQREKENIPRLSAGVVKPATNKKSSSSKDKSCHLRKPEPLTSSSSKENKSKGSNGFNSSAMAANHSLLKSSNTDFDSTHLKKQFALRRELLSCVF